jgi:hypothetical protein
LWNRVYKRWLSATNLSIPCQMISHILANKDWSTILAKQDWNTIFRIAETAFRALLELLRQINYSPRLDSYPCRHVVCWRCWFCQLWACWWWDPQRHSPKIVFEHNGQVVWDVLGWQVSSIEWGCFIPAVTWLRHDSNI